MKIIKNKDIKAKIEEPLLEDIECSDCESEASLEELTDSENLEENNE